MTTYPESYKYGAVLTQSRALNTVKTATRQGGNRVSQAERKPLIRDSHGELLRARTFSATAIHTPKPEDPTRTLCGGRVMLTSEFTCEGADSGYRDWDNDPERGRWVQGCQEHGTERGLHQADLTVCAGEDPQLCIRCEKSIAKRQREVQASQPDRESAPDAFSVNAPTFLPQYGREVHIATEDGQRALCSETHRALGSGLLPEFPVPVREAGYEWDASSYRLCPDCESKRQATTDSGFAPGQPYFEICAASGPDAFNSKRNPTCANQGTAEHNAREYSRDGRSYVVEHIDAEGKRSKVSEFRNGRKIRQASA